MPPPAPETERYPGYPHFLRAAAEELGLSEAAARRARAQPSVNQLSSLVDQHRPGDPLHPDTARVMGEHRDGLKVAARAAELMIAWLGPAPTIPVVDDLLSDEPPIPPGPNPPFPKKKPAPPETPRR